MNKASLKSTAVAFVVLTSLRIPELQENLHVKILWFVLLNNILKPVWQETEGSNVNLLYIPISRVVIHYYNNTNYFLKLMDSSIPMTP